VYCTIYLYLQRMPMYTYSRGQQLTFLRRSGFIFKLWIPENVIHLKKYNLQFAFSLSSILANYFKNKQKIIIKIISKNVFTNDTRI